MRTAIRRQRAWSRPLGRLHPPTSEGMLTRSFFRAGAEEITTSRDDRILILGLDGATFDLLRPLADKGAVPNLARLMRAGATATLRSTIPALTPPAWVSSVTGVNPGAHGIFDFLTESNRLQPRPVTTGDWMVEPFWRTFNRAGFRVGVMNFPVSYPPFPLSGFMVSGMMTPPGAADFIHPPRTP